MRTSQGNDEYRDSKIEANMLNRSGVYQQKLDDIQTN